MFVDRFNELLSENGLNRKQFSERSGIPYPTIIGWTKLNRLPDYIALNKIADFFQCSVDCVMGRQDNFEKPSTNSFDMFSKEGTFIKAYKNLSKENQELIITLIERLSN